MDPLNLFSSEELGVKNEDPVFMARFERQLNLEPQALPVSLLDKVELVQISAATAAAALVVWNTSSFWLYYTFKTQEFLLNQLQMWGIPENSLWVIVAGLVSLGLVLASRIMAEIRP